MDSGATHYITPHRSDFIYYTSCCGAVCLEDESTISQVEVGSVVFIMSQEIPITLSNVLHLPEVKTHFMSTCVLAQKGAEVLFDSGSSKISVNKKCVATGYFEVNLYWLYAFTIDLNVHTKSAATSLHTWNQCMRQWDTSPTMHSKHMVFLPLQAWISVALPWTLLCAMDVSLESPFISPFLCLLHSGQLVILRLCIVTLPVQCKPSLYKALHTLPPS